MKTRILCCIMALWLAACQPTSPPHKTTISFAWSYHAGDYIRARPMVSSSVVYLGADDNAIHAINTETGELLWRYETADNITATPAVFEDLIYFGSWDGFIYALETQQGKQRWQHQTEGWVTASPMISGTTLYVGSHDGFFYALAAEDGDLEWRYQTDGRIEAGATLAGELAFVGSTDNYLYALDVAGGALQWRYRTAGDIGVLPIFMRKYTLLCGEFCQIEAMFLLNFLLVPFSGNTHLHGPPEAVAQVAIRLEPPSGRPGSAGQLSWPLPGSSGESHLAQASIRADRWRSDTRYCIRLQAN